MPLSTSIHSYADVKQVLEAAHRAGGGRYRLSTRGEAVHWRSRAYKYRILLREQLAAGVLVPGYVPETPYDTMKLTLEENTVVIQFITPKGKLETLDGEPIEAPKGAETVEDPLLAEAEALAKRLTGEE